MSTPARRRSPLVLALSGFLAALLPLAAATAYCIWRTRQLAHEVTGLERRLATLDAQLAPIGQLDKLRSQVLARRSIVTALQEPQRGLRAALMLPTQLPEGARLTSLDIGGTALSLRFAADAATAEPMIERLRTAGFSDVLAVAPETEGSVSITARLDPARFSAAAAGNAVTP